MQSVLLQNHAVLSSFPVPANLSILSDYPDSIHYYYLSENFQTHLLQAYTEFPVPERAGKCIKYLMIPQFHYCLFPARSFRPAVPAIIIIRSILIMFTILLIVFRIVRHQIIQGKSILISNVVKDSLLFEWCFSQ